MLPNLNLAEPVGMALLFKSDNKRRKTRLYVTENILVNLDVLVDLLVVNFKLNNLCLIAELLSVAGNSVRKTRRAGNHQIAFGGNHTGFVTAVHTDVADTERITRGDCAESHQRAANGSVNQPCEFLKLLAGVRADNSAAGVNHRALGVSDKLLNPADTAGILNFNQLFVSLGLRSVFGGLSSDVLGDVNQNRTFSAVLCKSESPAD